MEKFTASEVRNEASNHWRLSDGPQQTLAGKMLQAYADRLEADEKAVPVYQHRSKNGPMLRWFDCSEETFMAMEHNEHDREHFDRRILYTHPAPADVERLAEALHDCIRDLRIAAEYGKTMRNPKALLETVERAEKALAAHSASAQPPVIDLDVLAWEQIKQAAAESKWIPHEHYYANDWHSDVCKFLREGAEQFIEPNSAQPPAASVPNGLIDALRDATYVAGMLDAICETDGTVDRMQARDAAFLVRDALQAHSDQAQPTAASVTEEMVERARSAFVQADDGSTGITDAMRSALVAALENPNG